MKSVELMIDWMPPSFIYGPLSVFSKIVAQIDAKVYTYKASCYLYR